MVRETITVNLLTRVDSQDVRALLRVCGRVAQARHEPRRWRQALLEDLADVLDAKVGILQEVDLNHGAPRVRAFWDKGWGSPRQRETMLRELNSSTIHDPLLLELIKRIADGRRRAATARISEVVSPEAWSRLPLAIERRRSADVEDCVGSAVRLAQNGRAVALVFFRACAHATKFSEREKTLLELCHSGLQWIYEEEMRARPEHAAALSPRLSQTLRHLAAGRDERETAAQMGLSPHTVHDYVKALYEHFGVSSRKELLERWGQVEGKKRNS